MDDTTNIPNEEQRGRLQQPVVRGRLPFTEVYIETSDRFVGYIYDTRVSIAKADCGTWQCDVYRGRLCLFDGSVSGENINWAISEAIGICGI
jgi:hypothetical protein